MRAKIEQTLIQVYRRRVARRSAGIVGVLGVSTMAGLAALQLWSATTWALAATWPVLAIVFTLQRHFARVPNHVRHSRFPIALLHLARLERGSLAWPLAAAGLLLPASIHLVAAVAFGKFSGDSFGRWIAVGAVVAGPSYIVLTTLLCRFATEQTRFGRAGRKIGWSGEMIYLATIIASVFPAGILLMLPPLAVAATGVFIPFVCWVAEMWLGHEREALEGLCRERRARRTPDENSELLKTVLDARALVSERLDAIDRLSVVDVGLAEKLLGEPDPRILQVTLDVCRQLGVRPSMDVLVPLLRCDDAIATRAVERLSARPEAEAVLNQHAFRGTEAVRLCIIGTMVESGSAASIRSLEAIAKAHGTCTRRVRRAAKRGLTHIERQHCQFDRARGPEPRPNDAIRGGLSVVEGGALSVPEPSTPPRGGAPD